MLLMAEKCIRGTICHSLYRYTKANNKCMKYYDKYKESSYTQYWGVNNFFADSYENGNVFIRFLM